MIEGTPVHADCKAAVVVDTNDMAWEPALAPGVSRKVLERIIHPRKGRETALFKLEPGASMPVEVLRNRVEIVVLEGAFEDEAGRYTKETFVRLSPGTTRAISSRDGCTLYVKERVPIRPSEQGAPRFVVAVDRDQWHSFPARGARGLPLYRDPNGLETMRMGEVFPSRNIPTHAHPIGEETLVLYGMLKDEHRTYTQGCWFRYPNGYAHAPFTTPDAPAGMLIREGDLIW